MINVLQAMILTDKEKMVLTPTYYVFKMYTPFQDSTFVPVTFDAGTYTHGDITLPRVDAIAAKDTSRQAVDSDHESRSQSQVDVEANLCRHRGKIGGMGETLTAPKVDSINTFDAPNDRRAEARFSKGSRRQAGPETGAEVGDRYLR